MIRQLASIGTAVAFIFLGVAILGFFFQTPIQ